MHQQVGTVQGYAVPDTQESRRHHRDPGREIPVMYMYVFDPALLQLLGVAGAQQGVQQSAPAPPRPLAPLCPYPQPQICQRSEVSQAEPPRAEQQPKVPRLQVQGFRCEPFQLVFFHPFIGSPGAA